MEWGRRAWNARRDWLGRQDSNLGMAESKSGDIYARTKRVPTVPVTFTPRIVNELPRLSECTRPTGTSKRQVPS